MNKEKLKELIFNFINGDRCCVFRASNELYVSGQFNLDILSNKIIEFSTQSPEKEKEQ